ncbi:hypothetical protein EMEDMD4_1320004 [Sinorhizobium medicae]|uniref:Uncharacterized protein n=1 Tax=Sinorhizobium medicae TaxID=110321 RepID=A0A508WS99_9HYPH|nr:hypothetical protein EMEDMD4_1320004 [Sinorhizobium medicae]
MKSALPSPARAGQRSCDFDDTVSGGRWIISETDAGRIPRTVNSIFWFRKANADATTIFWDEFYSGAFKYMFYAVHSATSQLLASLQATYCLRRNVRCFRQLAHPPS